MSIDDYVRKRRNPFTGKDIEIIAVEEICPRASWAAGPHLRLEAGALDDAYAEVRGCRVGGPALKASREEKFFVAQLDFDELARAHDEAVPLPLPLPRTGLLALFVDSDPAAPPMLEYFETLPEVGPPEPGRALLPKVLPIDPKADDDFENQVADAWLAHRVGWAREPQGMQWLDIAIHLELEKAGVAGNGLAGLRAAERRGVDVVELHRAAMKWKLVWQLATDDDLSFDWGDGGRLLVLIRDQDLAARRFDRAEIIVAPFS